MVDKPRWEVPDAQQPRPEEVEFDLDRTLQSIVNIEAEVPSDAFTATTLGTERAGSGIVIRDTGLVLTIGYLVTEAENVVIVDGRRLALDLDAFVIAQLDCGADCDGGLEARRLPLFGGQQFHLRPVDRQQFVLSNGARVDLGDDILERFAGNRL